MARPTKLTPEVQGAICEALRHCASLEAASEAADVSYDSFNRWMQDPRPRFCKFRVAVKRAIADGQLNHLAAMEEVGADDWRYHAWILEHRHKKDFGAAVDVTTGGEKITGIIQIIEHDGQET